MQDSVMKIKIYKYTLIFLILFFGILYAQDLVIEIRDFKGIWTNADLEDIPKENFVELKNLRPVSGKLVKTFGFCSYGYDAVSDVDNIVTYIENNLTNPDDYAYLVYIVKDDSVKIKHWNTSTENWENWGLSEIFYHKDAQNPIIQEGGIIRFLPGNVDTIGTSEAKGIWYGYIDREFFDSLYTPTAQFMSYITTPSIPSYDIAVSQYDSGSIVADSYYKFSYIYDGIQEGLLSDGISVNIPNSGQFLKFSFIFPKSNHNWRQTALNIYRSDAIDGEYNELYTIDYLREKGTAVSGDSAYNLNHYIYVPDLNDYNFNSSYWYNFDVGNLAYDIRSISGTGHQFFEDTTDLINTNSWNKDWKLYESTDGISYSAVEMNDEGAFAGRNIVALDTSVSITNIGNGILYYWIGDSVRIKEVEASEENAILFKGDSLEHDTLRTWRLLNVSDGLYYIEDISGNADADSGLIESILSDIVFQDTDILTQTDNYWRGGTLKMLNGANAGSTRTIFSSSQSWNAIVFNSGFSTMISVGDSYKVSISSTDSVKYEFFDTGLTEGAEYYLTDEASIKINGKYARIIGQRLWQGNLVLDPAGDSEIKTDWVSYSELGQYDVNPVSNIISFANEGIGEITGIAELYGNPIIMKKNNISMINIKSYPVTPANWNIIESVHNVGNIADNGYITVLGKLYVPSYDGIYEFTPNDLAESATTPTRRLKITEPIEDTYLALTLVEKEAIISEYNQKYNEIYFVLGDEMWAYNVNGGYWREILSIIPEVMCLDDTANVMMHDNLTDLLYYSGKNGYTSIDLKTKTFAVREDEREMINIISINYKSSTDLTLNLFSENSDTVRVAKTLPANNKVETIRFGNWDAVYKFSLGIIDSLSSNTNSEIHKIRILF